jgi:prepilin-type N-terminal cleavage/methylation domain-containing protein
MRTRASRHDRRRSGGFTLIEIGVVIAIIGLLMSFILVVSMQGIERAKERATQSLIAKLDTLIQDRLDVILSKQAPVNLAHQYLANPLSLDLVGFPPKSGRAEVIARADYVRAEMPDVFFLQVAPTSLSQTSTSYPFNFGAIAYPYAGTTVNGSATDPYVLPLGNNVAFDPTNPASTSKGAVPYFGTPPQYFPPPGYNTVGTGIYGASYGVAGGLYKNLGTASVQLIGTTPAAYLPTGYDGVDNNANGLVDEFAEGVDANNITAVLNCLKNHRHETARAEMLYAFLIESPGALVTRDSFQLSEIADTDGDGLPEFVDAWGNPILFFRWPTHYHSDLQRGINPEGFDGIDNNGDGNVDEYAEAAVYLNVSENREVNGLDPQNLLLSPVWWSDPGAGNTSAAYPWTKANVFQQMFFSLVEPLASTAKIDNPPRWDRAGFFKRRNFQTRFLVLSSGPDNTPGVFTYPNSVVSTAPNGPQAMAQKIILFEGIAGTHAMDDPPGTNPQYTLGTISGTLGQVPAKDPATTQSLIYAGQDDVTNHNLKASGVTSR